MATEIKKPFTMQVEEFDATIIEAINSSSIHPSVLLMRLENIVANLRNEIEYVKQNETAEYNKAVNSQLKEDENLTPPEPVD
jgi:hypothetical protein